MPLEKNRITWSRRHGRWKELEEENEDPKTMLYDPASQAWKDLAAGGDAPKGPGRQTLAYDGVNDIVLCVHGGQTYVYEVGRNAWKLLPVEKVDVVEMLVFDTRHKVFLGTAAMGRPMWAFRYGRPPGG